MITAPVRGRPRQVGRDVAVTLTALSTTLFAAFFAGAAALLTTGALAAEAACAAAACTAVRASVEAIPFEEAFRDPVTAAPAHHEHRIAGRHVLGPLSLIIDPGHLPAKEADATCNECHAKAEVKARWTCAEHSREKVTCITCHRVDEEYGKTNGQRTVRPGDALLLHGTLPPAHVRTRPFYRDRALKHRAARPVVKPPVVTR